MSDTSLGSYHISLGMQADHDSFNKAKQSSDSVSNSIARLVGTVRNSSAIIAAGLGAISIGASKTQTGQAALANVIGITAHSMDKIRVSVKLLGADSKGVTNEMAALENRIQRMNVKGDKIDEVSTAFARLRQEAARTNKEFEDITHEKFIAMNADQRFLTLMQMAEAVKDKTAAGIFISDLLGGASADFLNRLNLTGMSVGTVMKKADGISTVDETSVKKALGFQNELNTTTTIAQSYALDFGSNIAAQLTPVLKDLNDFLYNNKDTIKKTLDTIADGVGKVVSAVEIITKWLAPKTGGAVKETLNVGSDLQGMIDGYNKIQEGKERGDAATIAEGQRLVEEHKEHAGKTILGESLYNERQEKLDEISAQYVERQEEINKNDKGLLKLWNSTKNVVYTAGKKVGTEFQIGNARINGAQSLAENERIIKLSEQLVQLTMKGNTFNKVNLNELSPDMQQEAKDLGLEKFSRYINLTGSIQDGIIRPNGQITQVAPDDWVFAARNIGDLASAFIPESLIHQHTMNAPQDIVINQTINITSPTDLLPQTIKEQAHSGAYDALKQVMTEGHRRLALMTGMR